MRIGELAARAGVNVQTILYYERRRLLPRPARTGSGYRSYGESELAQIRFIRQTQQLGFSLREIAALRLVHGHNSKDEARRTENDELALYRLVSVRLAHVDAQIATLRRIRAALRATIDASRSRLTACPASMLPKRRA